MLSKLKKLVEQYGWLIKDGYFNKEYLEEKK